ncbi:SRPBCC family protein [Puia dinghuensis]|uniref:ATPase n=1 Tax=Puia dinghuensis TaxID=1792502 RepID=A0A8J2XQE5_9BACT|nr:SRPBCC family protein [Puia dinghuensis]GGA84551.1 ATPase [Puia dinghuensis]
MDTMGKMIAPDTLRFERLLPGPIERVWAYLTESDKRGKWFASGEMQLFEGGKATLFFLHKELSPVPGPPPEKFKDMEAGTSSTGTILKVNAPYLLSFTFEGDSEVTITLEEKQDKVLLVLTHTKLPKDTYARISMSGGWHTHLDVLQDHLEGKVPPNFWQRYMEMEEEYARRF